MNQLHNFSGIKTSLTALSMMFALSTFAQENLPYIPYQQKNNEPAQVLAIVQQDTLVILPNTISFHPFLLVDGTVALGYERALRSKKHAARLVLGIGGLDESPYYESKVKDLKQFYAEGDFKFFLSRKRKKAPTGLYAAPFAQYRVATYNYESLDTVASAQPFQLYRLQTESVAGGLMLGFTGIFLEMLTLEAYMGVGQQVVIGDYNFKIGGKTYKPLSTGYFWNNGPLFKLGLSIGVNF